MNIKNAKVSIHVDTILNHNLSISLVQIPTITANGNINIMIHKVAIVLSGKNIKILSEMDHIMDYHTQQDEKQRQYIHSLSIHVLICWW